VTSNATQKTVFEGIGDAVAKCRADFGVEITLDLTPLIPDPVSGNAASHFATGSIRYPAPPGDNGAHDKYVGRILYLKTSIVGDETADLLHHKGPFQTFRKTPLQTNGLKATDVWGSSSPSVPSTKSYCRLGARSPAVRPDESPCPARLREMLWHAGVQYLYRAHRISITAVPI
jgi:hypothetical protein